MDVVSDRLFGYYYFYVKKFNTTHPSKVRNIRKYCPKLNNRPKSEGVFYHINHYFQSKNYDKMKVIRSFDINTTAQQSITFPQTVSYLAIAICLWFEFSVKFGFQVPLKFLVYLTRNIG